MSELTIVSLNSGSNGNCYYVGNQQDAVLVDAGISCRETERRMSRAGLDMQHIRAILVSHEHSDHIRGVAVLARKYRLPVYITPKTRIKSRLILEDARAFSPAQPLHFGQLQVRALRKYHDACDPHSFTISDGRIRVGVFTDIGVLCPNVIAHFQQCHAAILEANYDEEMLENGRYPRYLKNRIRGGLGHLSNKQALHLFSRYRPDFMSHLLLGHLSADNNCPRLLADMFAPYSKDTRIDVASRYRESEVYRITAAAELAG